MFIYRLYNKTLYVLMVFCSNLGGSLVYMEGSRAIKETNVFPSLSIVIVLGNSVDLNEMDLHSLPKFGLRSLWYIEEINQVHVPTNWENTVTVRTSFTYTLVTFTSTYSKTCLKRPLKNDKTKVITTTVSLMKFECIAECSLGAFCNTFDLH